MATYVNDLRLKEIATGDESGTWGTSTNTNLELIGEAFSFGTEAITTNADTHTTTIADGSTDPGRSLYLKYTGTLDSACTITIGPNTVSKLWFIENGTSGSQNIIISQGSGANVTIPAGHVKAIYSDGAGSGAAMVDAFTDLNLAGTTTIDVLSASGNATIGGTLGVTGIVTLTDDLIIGDGKTIGSASDVDAMTIAANGQVTFSQTLIGTALDISGDIDVDGTTNLDAVDIDGAVDMASTLNVSGAITGTLGTAAQPNITSVGTLTSFRSTGIDDNADALAITIDSSENVGIGLTNQANKLQVNGDICIGKATTSADLKSTLKMRGANGSNELQVFDLVNDGENGRVDFKYNRAGGAAQTIMSFGSTVGNIGIGTASPVSPLNVQQSGDAVSSGFTITRTGANRGSFFLNSSNDTLNITRGATAAIAIDNSGNVGIGTDSPSAALDVEGGVVFNDDSADVNFRVESNGNANMLFVDGGNDRVGIGTGSPEEQFSVQDGSGGIIFLGRTTGSTTGLLGRIEMGNTDIDSAMGGIDFTQDGATNSSRIGLFTQTSGGAATERVRIDSSGNLLVSTTSIAVAQGTGTGVSIRDMGRVEASADGNTSAIFNRVTSDGGIVNFSKDGTTVGSIGTASSIMYIGTGDVGIRTNAISDTIEPFNTSNTNVRDALIDLGSSGARFKDLYLSGTANAASVAITNDAANLSIQNAAADTGQKFRRNANNHLIIERFASGSTSESMRIDSSGNLGIGETSPAAPLHVKGASNQIRIQDSTNDKKYDLNVDGDKFFIDDSTAGVNVFAISGTNLGLGTSSPAHTLDVQKSGDNLMALTGVVAGGITSIEMRQSRGSLSSPSGSSANGDGNFIVSQIYRDSGYNTCAHIGLVTGASTDDGQIRFSTALSGTVSEAMRLTENGVLQINAVARQTMAEFNNRQNGAAIEFGHENNSGKFYGTLGVFGSNGSPYIGFSTDCEASANTFTTRGAAGNIITGNQVDSALQFMQVTSTTATGQTPAERIRIDNAGNLLVGTTTAPSSTNAGGAVFLGLTQGRKQLQLGHTSSSTLAVAQFFGNSSTTAAGNISCSGGATDFNTSSDARRKNVLGEAKGLEVINKLNPVHFEWKESKEKQDGLIAQEVEPVVSNAVSINDDGYYVMDYSKLVTPLIKAIQEQQEQIDALQSEINLLKGE